MAVREVTVPASNDLVGRTDTQTITGKTLTTPTIVDLTNVAHDHLDADDGGTLTAAAISDFAEAVDDRIDALIVAGDALGKSYDDAGNTYTLHALSTAVIFNAFAATQSNMAAADTEYPSASVGRRFRRNLTWATQARLVVQVLVVGTAGADIRPEYSTDNVTYAALGTGSMEVSLAATGVIDSGWVDLAAGAKADVYLRLMAKDGDGVADPQVGMAELQFR